MLTTKLKNGFREVSELRVLWFLNCCRQGRSGGDFVRDLGLRVVGVKV